MDLVTQDPKEAFKRGVPKVLVQLYIALKVILHKIQSCKVSHYLEAIQPTPSSYRYGKGPREMKWLDQGQRNNNNNNNENSWCSL